jgi:hypothetical protein
VPVLLGHPKLMRSASLIAIVLAASFLFAQANLKAATEGFDGNWSVTVDHKLYENPDGSKALPFVWHFPATVKKRRLPRGDRGPGQTGLVRA